MQIFDFIFEKIILSKNVLHIMNGVTSGLLLNNISVIFLNIL